MEAATDVRGVVSKNNKTQMLTLYLNMELLWKNPEK